MLLTLYLTQQPCHFASGRVVAPWLTDLAFCRLMQLTRLFELLDLLLLGSLSWCLELRPVPSDATGLPYGELVQLLLDRHQAPPLGLLRMSAAMGAPPVLVLANPPADTVVDGTDRVFVLAEAGAWQRHASGGAAPSHKLASFNM